MKLAVLIVTYNRVEDAKAQMELIRNLWVQYPTFKNIFIVHSYNGKVGWYKQQYKEDLLVRSKNLGHFDGAANLIDLGMRAVLNCGKNFDYIIVTSSDVWIVNPLFLQKIISKMKAGKKQLATSIWFFQYAIATEFFIITPALAKKVFPLNLKEFRIKYRFLDNMSYAPVFRTPIVEVCFAERARLALKNDLTKILLVPGREVAHWINHRKASPIGYTAEHDPVKKRQLIINKNLSGYGPTLKKLLDGRAKFLKEYVRT